MESAVVVTLPLGNNTAQARGVSGGAGIGTAEIYDLDPFPANPGRLTNISTRGLVETGDNALIGCVIARGDAAEKVVIRAIGPELSAAGVAGALQDPTLELRNHDGTLVTANDNWRDQQAAEIMNSGLAPKDDRASAVIANLAPGNYTAIVRGKGNATGIGLVEFYDLQP